MAQEMRLFLKDFFRQVTDQPLGPDDERYIPLYDDPEITGDDPVQLMARAIEWTPGESVQLLSGFRGAGKSTELRRLQGQLEQEGYTVFACDIGEYINLSAPVDVSDFLMAVAGAFSDAIAGAGFSDARESHENYWERLAGFLNRIEFNGVSAKIGTGEASLTIRANLRSDPSFKSRLQEHMSGHLGALVKDVREYVESCVGKLQDDGNAGREVVLLVDSIERFRGTLANAQDVQSSVETLFVSHAERLHLPRLHVVYTVPPYLKIRHSNLGALYHPGGVHVLTALKLRDRNGCRNEKGYDAMARIVAARGDWENLLGDRSALDELIRFSGGHLRDLLRLLAQVILRATTLPVGLETVTAAIDQLRTEFLPIADDDARWLADIARSHQAALSSTEDLPVLARYFDTHLALCYRNGDEWYDVHPLVSDYVTDKAEELSHRGEPENGVQNLRREPHDRGE